MAVEPTPSAQPVAGDAAQEQPVSREASDQPSASGWHNLFGLLPGKKPSEGATDEKVTAEQAASAQTSQTLTLTQEELDRKVQAETDRREAKRQRDLVEQARKDRELAIERKLTPGAPDYDPYEGAEERDKLRKEAEASEQFTSFLGDIGKQHDTATLDVLTAAVPKPELERIMALEGAGVGLDGRKLITTEALKALEKHWKAEGQRAAEARLREDPMFRKRVFAEHRGDADEPELLAASGSTPSGDPFMNQILSDYHAAKGRGRRR